MAIPIRRCADPECQHELPPTASLRVKYCQDPCADCAVRGLKKPRCAQRVTERKTSRRKALEARELKAGAVEGQVSRATSADGRASARRGDDYVKRFCAGAWGVKLDDGLVTVNEAAVEIGTSAANVSRWLAAWHEDELKRRERAGWEGPADVALLEPTAEAFAAFRSRYFTDEKGRAYITPAVQRRWIRAILVAITRGRRQVILTPPRHGKSEMLIHFCIWLICRNPNIRILWIGPNEKIALQSGRSIIDQLENNDLLRAEMLGPGESWKPGTRSGASWTAAQATVATRTLTGIKSPTVACIGKGGGLLSRDADFIVADDIVDMDDATSPAARDDLEQWFITQLSSRKQDHTGLVAIGSRQGHNELWGTLLTNPGWASIVEHAHDLECNLPMHGAIPVEEHDACSTCPPVDLDAEDIAEPCDHVKCEICAAHVDCMLIPELASMHFLQNQRTSAQNETYFEMVYQNITRADGAVYVTVEHLKRCRNTSRRIGCAPDGEPIVPGQSGGLRLIGGLDPATSGRQAAFLWGFDGASRKRFMVDIDDRLAGGLPGARAVIRDWHERYGLKTWVVESVGYQQAILQDGEIMQYCAANGVVLMPHITDRWNKWDKNFGVTAQFELFKLDVPLVDLPYGDEASIERVRVYERQLLDFEPGAKNNGDALMAAWFPETQIRYWLAESRSSVVHVDADDDYSSLALGDVYEFDLLSA